MEKGFCHREWKIILSPFSIQADAVVSPRKEARSCNMPASIAGDEKNRETCHRWSPASVFVGREVTLVPSVE
jgi:hypothetical protein